MLDKKLFKQVNEKVTNFKKRQFFRDMAFEFCLFGLKICFFFISKDFFKNFTIKINGKRQYIYIYSSSRPHGLLTQGP